MRRPFAIPAPLLAAALAVAGASWLASCGSATPGASLASGPAVAGGSSLAPFPLKCVGQSPSDKRLPPAARETVRQFVRAIDDGEPGRARRLLVPESAGEIMSGLAAVERLQLVSLQDRY